MAEQGEEETRSSGDGGANPPLDKLLFSDGGENAGSKLIAEIEDLERSSRKRPIDGRPGMAAERGGAGGGQASIRVGASRRSLIRGGKKLGVSNCSSLSFYPSSLRCVQANPDPNLASSFCSFSLSPISFLLSIPNPPLIL
ncbi:hypothetical protein LINPERHAP1_LOCUS22397 [Linum perenne]